MVEHSAVNRMVAGSSPAARAIFRKQCLMWLIYTLLASVFWGLSYVISEILLKKYDVPFFFFSMFTALFTCILWVVVNFFYPQLFTTNLLKVVSDKTIMLLLIVDVFLIVSALTLTFIAIKDKDAVIVTLIEISYPFFTMIFSLLLISSTQISIYSILGGILIFAGVGVISIFG